MSIAAIETRYRGYRFRSRLEARWAVFLDALGVEWEYERQGYVIGDGTCFLPDFFIGGPAGQSFWLEIKGAERSSAPSRSSCWRGSPPTRSRSRSFVLIVWLAREPDPEPDPPCDCGRENCRLLPHGEGLLRTPTRGQPERLP